MIFISSAALSKIRRAAGTCHSVLTKRWAFWSRAKVAVDSVDRCSSASKLFQVSGPETAKFLWPMAVAVHCTLSLPEAADRSYRRPVRWTTGWQSSARYGGARPILSLSPDMLSPQVLVEKSLKTAGREIFWADCSHWPQSNWVDACNDLMKFFLHSSLYLWLSWASTTFAMLAYRCVGGKNY